MIILKNIVYLGFKQCIIIINNKNNNINPKTIIETKCLGYKYIQKKLNLN